MKTMIALSFVIALTSCASHGNKIDRNYASTIQKGVTTENDVIAKMGQPTSKGYNSEGHRTLTYLHVSTRTKASTFIPVVGLFTGGADTESTILVINIDSDTGIVKDWNYNQSNSEVNTGLIGN